LNLFSFLQKKPYAGLKPFLPGFNIKVQCRYLLKGWINQAIHFARVESFEVFIAFVTQINSQIFFFFAEYIMEVFAIRAVAKRAVYSFYRPCVPAETAD
jgi:hypothetical protein